MSHPAPPQRQPPISDTEKYAKTVHTAAVIAVVACPLLALLPPRKLDIYTLGLVGTTAYSGNYLLREASGRSVWQHIGRMDALAPKQQHNAQQTSLVEQVQRQNRASLAMDQAGMSQTHRDAWKVQREKEIKQDVEEGKGFGDMIMDQIWEVWNWGKPRDEDESEEG